MGKSKSPKSKASKPKSPNSRRQYKQAMAAELLYHGHAFTDADGYELVPMSETAWKTSKPPRLAFMLRFIETRVVPVKQQIFIKHKKRGAMSSFDCKVTHGKKTTTFSVNRRDLQPCADLDLPIENQLPDTIKTAIVNIGIARGHIHSLAQRYVSDEAYKDYLRRDWAASFLSTKDWYTCDLEEKHLYLSRYVHADGSVALKYQYRDLHGVTTGIISDYDLSLAKAGILALLEDKAYDYLTLLIFDYTKSVGLTHKNSNPKKKVESPYKAVLKESQTHWNRLSQLKQGYSAQTTPLKELGDRIRDAAQSTPKSQIIMGKSTSKHTPDDMVRVCTAGATDAAKETSYYTPVTPGNKTKEIALSNQATKWFTSNVTCTSHDPEHYRLENKSKRGTVPKVRVSKRDVLNDKYGKGTFEVLHIVAHRFKSAIKQPSNTLNNLVIGTKHANSAMILVEDAITALIIKYQRPFYIWADVNMDKDCVAHELIYHVSLEKPTFTVDKYNPSVKHALQPHYKVTFPLLINTKPAIVHRRPLFEEIEAYYSSSLTPKEQVSSSSYGTPVSELQDDEDISFGYPLTETPLDTPSYSKTSEEIDFVVDHLDLLTQGCVMCFETICICPNSDSESSSSQSDSVSPARPAKREQPESPSVYSNYDSGQSPAKIQQGFVGQRILSPMHQGSVPGHRLRVRRAIAFSLSEPCQDDLVSHEGSENSGSAQPARHLDFSAEPVKTSKKTSLANKGAQLFQPIACEKTKHEYLQEKTVDSHHLDMR